MKHCTKCKQEKDLSEFHRKRKGLSPVCKLCANARTARWREENPEKRNAHYHEHKEVHFERHIRGEYGISLKEYNKMLESQEFCCKICGIPQTELIQRLSVDHCHQSGKIRGLLCNLCNRALGQFKDKPANLLSALEYFGAAP